MCILKKKHKDLQTLTKKTDLENKNKSYKYKLVFSMLCGMITIFNDYNRFMIFI